MNLHFDCTRLFNEVAVSLENKFFSIFRDDLSNGAAALIAEISDVRSLSTREKQFYSSMILHGSDLPDRSLSSSNVFIKYETMIAKRIGCFHSFVTFPV